MAGPMVCATLRTKDPKTVTRRLVKHQGETVPSDRSIVLGAYQNGSPCWWAEWPHTYGPRRALDCPFGVAGDRLWVRETWAAGACADGLAPAALDGGFWHRENGGLWYAADDHAPANPISPRGKWRPSIHMPRWASRITLDVVSVRVERLHDITEEDAWAEGVEPHYPATVTEPHAILFQILWDRINGAGSWALNPWVWRIEFRRVRP